MPGARSGTEVVSWRGVVPAAGCSHEIHPRLGQGFGIVAQLSKNLPADTRDQTGL